MNYSKFYVDLDSILDTRAALLFKHDKEVFRDLLRTGKYHTRLSDDFPKVSREIFVSDYKNRTKHLLRDATVTHIPKMLKEFVEETLRNSVDTIHQLTPIVVLNIYPYILTDREIDILISSLASVLGNNCEIHAVNLNIASLTPNVIKKEFSILCMYDCFEWLEYHSANENFRKTTCPDIALYIPQLFLRKTPTQSELLNMEKNGDPFEILEKCTAPIIKLQHLPIGMYSLDVGRLIGNIIPS